MRIYTEKQGNRGVPSLEFEQETIANMASFPDDYFTANDKIDVYTYVKDELGPWRGLLHRKAVAIEIMMVLAGRESSWNHLEGAEDLPGEGHSICSDSSGAWQTSADAVKWDARLYPLLGSADCAKYLVKSKKDHKFSAAWTWLTLRNTTQHHGPIRRKEINEFLSRERVAKVEALLGGTSTPVTIPEPTPKLPPAGGLLWYPKAVRAPKSMKTLGYYPEKYPMGAIVHWTEGWSKKGLRNALDTISGGIRNGYAYLAVANDGQIVQAHPFDKWGSHAGPSKWKGLGAGVSSKLVGIEVCCAGKLKKLSNGTYKSEFGEIFNADEVRYSEGKDNIKKGYYHKYTAAQEKALVEILLWLKKNNPGVFSFDYVLGHDSVSPNRKSDCGASLSMSIPEFQRHLKALYK